MPALVELSRIARQRGTFAVWTVTVDESWEQVRRLFPRGTDLVVLFDPERQVVTERYGTEMFPETYLIDSEGVIRARFDGERDWTSPHVLQLIERYSS
jgi:hypothetical protein